MSKTETIRVILNVMLVILIPFNAIFLITSIRDSVENIVSYEKLLCIEDQREGHITEECESVVTGFMWVSTVSMFWVMMFGSSLSSGCSIALRWLREAKYPML